MNYSPLILLTTLMLAWATQAAERPNVVIIVSDDHGFGDIGWNNPEVRTPTLDQLAKSGIRLDRFYANPICSVTRAALMTGLATLRTGVNNSSGLDLKYRILPQAFQDAGYQTWMFGKWHLGGSEDSQRPGPQYFPCARGFDYFYGHLHGAIDYYTHQRKDLGKLDWQRNGQPVNEEGFSTDLLANDAIRMLRQRDRNKPFLLYLAFNAVHGPLQAPPSAPDVSRRVRRDLLLANVTHLDLAIGRLVRTLDEEHLRENTLIVFFGDNGGQLSQQASNGVLRGEKGGTFEGGIRVPALMNWPGVLRPAPSQQFLAVTDLFPTLAAAAGIATGISTPLDGVNLWPALVAGKEAARPPFVMGNNDVACLGPPWKLILTGRDAAPLLFNLVVDPSEQRDLAPNHPDVVASLMKVIAATGDPKSDGNKMKKANAKRRDNAKGKANRPPNADPAPGANLRPNPN